MKPTVQGLKERVEWLEDQLRTALAALARLEEAERRRKPKQESLPVIGPAHIKKPSVQQLDKEYFDRKRTERLKALGDFVPDEEANLAYVNARLKTIREACSSDDEFYDIVCAYMRDDWGAKLKPPYPFNAFCADTVWRKRLAEVRGNPTEARHG